MNGKKEFCLQLDWNLYNPKNFIFIFIPHHNYYNKNNLNIELLYWKILNFIKKSFLLTIKGKDTSPKTVEFHRKYGWILGKNKNYAFLGKIDVNNLSLKIKIGKNSYISGPSLFCGPGTVKIGSYSCIAENFKTILNEDDHNLKNLSFIKIFQEQRLSLKNKLLIKKFKKPLGNVNIGNNVWIGRNVTIKNFVTIEDNAVVGENSIVKSKVRNFEIYGGNPAKKISEVPNQKFKKKYKKWWNWSDTKIIKSIRLFQ